jgi:hypothetical protein
MIKKLIFSMEKKEIPDELKFQLIKSELMASLGFKKK